jgi:hypothetical protein
MLTRVKENSGMLVLAGAAGVALGAAMPSLLRRFARNSTGNSSHSQSAASSSTSVSASSQQQLSLPVEHCLYNVRISCERIVQLAKHVSLDAAAIETESAALASFKTDLAPWDVSYHFCDRQSDLTAQYVLVLDAMNFCFWPLQGSLQFHISMLPSLSRFFENAKMKFFHPLQTDSCMSMTIRIRVRLVGRLAEERAAQRSTRF